MIVIFLLGFFIDWLAIMFILVPIITPIAADLGFDPIWFGVIIVLVSEMGVITPPVGVNVFVIKGIAPDVPLYVIFRGIFPFLIAMMIVIALLVIFPEIALFLPTPMML